MGNLVGHSLAHFRIVAELGQGGMGVVYRATDEKLRRQVALKVLPDSIAKDEVRRQRFFREARSAAAVTHANIATVHEVGEADGHVFIAMELVEGETLRARLARGVSIADALRFARGIARGLRRAHEKGIVHRDLKPESVMISPDDEVKILDFGLPCGTFSGALSVGRVLLLAGRVDEAASALEESARTCSVIGSHLAGLDLQLTLDFIHSHVLLGQALEAKRDETGACKAYGAVLDRWRNARPRSVSVEKAKERSRALGCRT